MADLTHHTATEQARTANAPAILKSVSLSPAAAVSTLTVREGGATGTIRLVLQAAASGATVERLLDNVVFATGVHITLAGAGATATVETQ